MLRTMMKSKIHRATVTQADLHYVGSVTVDADLLDAANLLPGELVHIVDIDNGARLETYTIAGERGSGVIGINGAAARLVHPGDLVILIAYAQMEDAEARAFSPNVVFVDTDNKIIGTGSDPAEALPDSGLTRGDATPPHAMVFEPPDMTLLCLDIGNSHTQLGVFDGTELVAHWHVSTDERRTADEWHVLVDGLVRSANLPPITALSLCCTVPSVVQDMREMIERHHGDCQSTIVGPGVRTGVPIMTDNPREVGSDRIVNSLAAATLYGGPSIVVDFGTATTFDVIDSAGRYVGGAIAPGIAISVEALSLRGAQLRRVELVPPRGVIAKNTVEALQSGLVYGFAGQVDGIVTRMIDALGVDSGDLTVAATGELAHVVIDECSTITVHEPWLTLTGLRLVHEKQEG